MELELKVNNRNAIVKEVKRDGNVMTIAVDDELYEVDIVKVNNQEFSILYKGRSFNIEVIESKEPKHFNVNTLYFKFDVEVVDMSRGTVRAGCSRSRYKTTIQSGPRCPERWYGYL